MKAGIHPDYHMITVVMSDGSEYQTRTTKGKEGDVVRLEIDPISHPAWNLDATHRIVERAQLSKFSKRFGSIFGSSEGEAEEKEKQEEK